MCIVITKDKYVSMPSNNTLRRCWQSNPQGAGYMYTDPTTRQVIGKKGFMTLDAFLKELSNPKLDKMNVVIHFRIATHGGVNDAATHPFPISNKVDDLNALEWTSRAGIAHNGIIPGYGTQRGLSDTQEFIKNVLSKSGEHVLHPGVLSMTTALIGSSRLAIMRRDKIVRVGGGWVQFKGCWYSNSGYKKQVSSKWASSPADPSTDAYGSGWKKGCYWDVKTSKWVEGSRWDRENARWTTINKDDEVIIKPIVASSICTPQKEVEDVKPEPTGYDAPAPTARIVSDRPSWCNASCGSCAYYDNGDCIISEEMRITY